MALVYYTASSADGFIVDDAGSLDWLTSRDIDVDGPFGYRAFAKTVGALVMGATTYEWVRQHGDWTYQQPAWVLTSRSDVVAVGHPVATWSGDVAELYPTVVAAAGGAHVWLMGGGNVAAQFAAAGLIDEMIVSYAPCTLGHGAPVLPLRSDWRLAEVGRNADFACARWVRE